MAILRAYNIRPSRRSGQNYVVDPDLISCIVGAAGIERGETVLEIGAGVGTLTRALAAVAGKVIAVEKDRLSAKILAERFRGAPSVEVVHGDILGMKLPRAERIVSNLPYSISTPVTFKILREGGFKLAALTYQKEVAERLVAGPGGRDYSRLSVMSSLLAEVRKVRDFPPGAFYPEPEVESTVITVRPRLRGGCGTDWEGLGETLKALFSQRRRTLRKALATYAKMRGNPGHVPDLGLGPLLDVRVFMLTPEEFVRIDRALRGMRGEGDCWPA